MIDDIWEWEKWKWFEFRFGFGFIFPLFFFSSLLIRKNNKYNNKWLLFYFKRKKIERKRERKQRRTSGAINFLLQYLHKIVWQTKLSCIDNLYINISNTHMNMQVFFFIIKNILFVINKTKSFKLFL